MNHGTRTAIACVGLMAWAAASVAQHQGHQMGTGSAGGGPCQARATESLKIVESANRRLEEARQANSPQQMRAAMDELQAALGEIRAQLSLCVSPAAGAAGSSMEGMDHSGMSDMDHSAMEGMDHSGTAATGTKDSMKSMPGMAASPKRPVPPRKTTETDHSQMDMDHSKMSMPGMTAPAKPAETATAPPEGKETGQVSPQTTIKDPVCGMEVGSRTTEKATYQGKTYYFCSKADREKFLADPDKYVKR